MKKVISIILTVMIMASMVSSAYAMHYTRTGTAVYNGGSRIDVSYDNGSVGDFQPGDDLTVSVKLYNNGDVATDWYMENTIQKLFEDSPAAKNGSYTYRLTYNGGEIFSSDTIGGSGGANLDDATGQLNDFFYLGRIPAHSTGDVVLYFGIDGETQNNSYWNTLSQLNMRFAVEKTNRNPIYIVPKTADKGTAILWGVITIVCLEASLLIIVSDRKKRSSRKEGGK